MLCTVTDKGVPAVSVFTSSAHVLTASVRRVDGTGFSFFPSFPRRRIASFHTLIRNNVSTWWVTRWKRPFASTIAVARHFPSAFPLFSPPQTLSRPSFFRPDPLPGPVRPRRRKNAPDEAGPAARGPRHGRLFRAFLAGVRPTDAIATPSGSLGYDAKAARTAVTGGPFGRPRPRRAVVGPRRCRPKTWLEAGRASLDGNVFWRVRRYATAEKCIFPPAVPFAGALVSLFLSLSPTVDGRKRSRLNLFLPASQPILLLLEQWRASQAISAS